MHFWYTFYYTSTTLFGTLLLHSYYAFCTLLLHFFGTLFTTLLLHFSIPFDDTFGYTIHNAGCKLCDERGVVKVWYKCSTSVPRSVVKV